MKKNIVEITEHQKSLIQICLRIARSKFLDNAMTIALPRVGEQFLKQADETTELAQLFAGALSIVVTSETSDA